MTVKQSEGIVGSETLYLLSIELNRIFDSEKQAETELKIGVSRISECCSGKNKTAGGYHWRYADEISKEITEGEQ